MTIQNFRSSGANLFFTLNLEQKLLDSQVNSCYYFCSHFSVQTVLNTNLTLLMLFPISHLLLEWYLWTGSLPYQNITVLIHREHVILLHYFFIFNSAFLKLFLHLSFFIIHVSSTHRICKFSALKFIRKIYSLLPS